MKIEKIDHVAILVKDLNKAEEFFSDLFEMRFSKLGEVKEVDARSMMEFSGIELIEPLTPDGPTMKTLERRGEGLTLISLKVPDLDEAMAEMKAKGIIDVKKNKILILNREVLEELASGLKI